MASVDAMCIVTIATHMSMHVNTMRIACPRSRVVIDLVVGALCKGMVAGSPQGGGGGLHGTGGDARGGDMPTSNRQFGASLDAGVQDGAGTSRRRGRRVDRPGDGASSSGEE